MPAFSHNGAQLDYVCLLASGELSLYNIATSDGHPRPITTFSGWPQGIAWAALDRKLVFSISRFGLGEELIEFTPADSSIRSLPFGRQASWPTISADGSNLAYTSSSNTINIWRKDLLHPESASVKLISSTREQADPRYSPDGTLVAFMSTRAGVGEIWISDTSGGRVTQLSKFGNRFSGAPRWSPDSKRIVFDSWLLYHSAVYVMDISEGVPRKLVTSIAEMMEPSWSNDGKWIYFVSGAGDGQRVYRCPISGGDAVRLSVARGLRPQESADGETLYFAAEEHGSPIKMIHLKQPGSESELEGMPPLSNESLWTVAPGGIYFVPMSASDSISYFDFKTKQTRTVLVLDKRFFRGLSVSPDGRWILY
jgi:Tol biopolymer transport system component